MEQTTTSFFIGFLMAGLVGFISSLIVKSWNTIDKTQKQMFVFPPQPALKSLSFEKGVSGVGAIPNKSPIDVLSSGCLTIFLQLFIQIGLFIIIGIIFWLYATEEIPAGFFSGVLFAPIFGFLLQNIYYNYKRITTLYKLITNPPVPVLNPANPPNKQYLAARPTLPPCTVVVEGLFEITWRLVWTLVLFGILVLSISMVSSYLSEGEFGFPTTEEFEI